MTQTLTTKVVELVSQDHPDVGQWIEENINEDGPWQFKASEKSQLNCFLRYHLGCARADTSDVREYLSDEDSDDVWVESVVTHVAPVLKEHR